MIRRTNIILYVEEQARSREFYREVLQLSPTLDVPGMTEFEIADGVVLGLMPRTGIERLLEKPVATNGYRCELYLSVDDPTSYIERALAAGAEQLLPLEPRDWGDTAAYVSDPDKNVLAFATTTKQ